MYSGPEHRPPGGFWVTLAVAVPVFYFLFLPWVGVIRWKLGYRDSGAVFDLVCRPWDWMEGSPVVRDHLLEYETRCWKLAGVVG